MHGLLNNGLQCYVEDIFGSDVWEDTCLHAKLDFMNFEPTQQYEDHYTRKVIESLCSTLGRSKDEVLEDFGTYIVAEHHNSPVRRLLQFGGDTFEEFLHSLEDINDRATLAMPNLHLPQLWLAEQGTAHYTLHYRFEKEGFGAVVLGVLRAMADAYRALVTVEHKPARAEGIDKDSFEIRLLHLNWQQAADNRPV